MIQEFARQVYVHCLFYVTITVIFSRPLVWIPDKPSLASDRWLNLLDGVNPASFQIRTLNSRPTINAGARNLLIKLEMLS